MYGLEVGTTGQAAFASRDKPGWGNLGTVFDKDEKVTTSQMLTKAHLNNWNVRVQEIVTDARTKTPSFEVVRDNPFDGLKDRLGVVKQRYVTYQNEDLFQFGDNIISGGGQWETAGSLRNGGIAFGTLLLDREIVVGAGEADDKSKLYLLCSTSHDGTSAIRADVTTVRVDCMNSFVFALRGAVQSFKVRHTQTMEGRLIEAQKALGISFAYADVFEAEANKLYEKAVTDNQFYGLIKSIYPKPDADVKGALKKWETKTDIIFDIWKDSAVGPATTGAIGQTAWGALNALTEQLDWYRNPRGGNVENLFASQAGFEPVIRTQKQDILTAVKAFAGV